MVQASRAEACLAARLYNDSAEERSFEGFVIHMHLAWLYLLQAELTRAGTDFRYHRKDNPRLLEKVDGEPKRWELAKCVSERWKNVDEPVRRNLEFFIALRNKLEHRYVWRADLALSVALGGHAQALLLNYEEELVTAYGEPASLATRLRFPVFIGSFTEQGELALRRLRKSLPAPLRTFIAGYEASLPEGLANDRHFEFRLRVVTELAARDPDALAIQFSRYDDMSEDDKAAVEELGRKGVVIVRERQRDVVNLDRMTPRQVVREVNLQLPFVFHMGHFIAAWQSLGVRPAADADRPDQTDEKYCTYDQLHKDYGYTAAYVKKLVRSLRTVEGWREFFGKDPEHKQQAQEHPDPTVMASPVAVAPGGPDSPAALVEGPQPATRPALRR